MPEKHVSKEQLKRARLDDMPSDWSVDRLGSFAKTQYGLSQASDDTGEIPIIGMRNLVDGQVRLRDMGRVALSEPEVDRFALREGDILFNRTNSHDLVGKTAIVDQVPPDPVVFASYLVRIIVDRQRALPRFIVLFMNTHPAVNRLKDLATPGVSQYNINPSTLCTQFLVPLPPIEEQRAIVEVACAWDGACNRLEHLGSAKERRKKGLMQQLLTGKRRFPQFKGKPWRRCRIGDALKEVRRPVDWDDDHLYRLVSVRRWAGGVFLREELHGSEIKVKKLCTIHAGDMLISHIQSAYGAMALVSDEFDGCQVSDLYTVLVPKDAQEFDVRFFAYLAQRRYMWHQAYLASNGFFAERLRLNFNPADFLHRLIYVPPTLEEQQAVVATLAAVDREIKLLRQQLHFLKKQKRGLMQKLLTGEIRVKA